MPADEGVMGPIERRAHTVMLAAVLLAYVVIGIAYARVVPAWRGADELAHFGYVRHLALGRGLPVLGTRASDYPFGPSYEAHQPPLYYALGSLVYRVGSPSQEAASARLRLFSLVIGILVGLVGYLLAQEVWPHRPAAWVLTSAFILLVPSQAALFATVNNDVLTQLLFAVVLWQAARVLVRGASAKSAGVLGVCTGLAVLTKASAALLLALVPLALLLAAQSGSGARRGLTGKTAVVCLLVFFGSAAAVSGWWLWRNAVLYGDPLGMRALESYFRSAPSPDYFIRRVGLTYAQYWELVASWCFRSSFAAFPGMGNRTLFLAPAVYWAYAASWMLAAGGIAASGRRGEADAGRTHALWVLVTTAALLLGAHVRLNSVFFWAHARYVMAASAAFAVLWGGGIAELACGRLRWTVVGVTCAALAAANAASLVGVVGPHFAR